MTDWSHPVEVSDTDIAFPANAPQIMPSLTECKEGLAALSPDERQKWEHFQRTWFYEGLPDTIQVLLRTNNGVKVDGAKAFRHLSVIQGSFAPKHEHKMAAVAWLASLWFEDVAYGGFDFTNYPSARCINCTQKIIDTSEPDEPEAWTHPRTLRVPCDPDDLAGQGLDPANGYEACPTPPADDVVPDVTHDPGDSACVLHDPTAFYTAVVHRCPVCR